MRKREASAWLDRRQNWGDMEGRVYMERKVDIEGKVAMEDMERREDGRAEERVLDQADGFEDQESGRRRTSRPGMGGVEKSGRRRRRMDQRGFLLIDSLVSIFYATVRAVWVKKKPNVFVNLSFGLEPAAIISVA